MTPLNPIPAALVFDFDGTIADTQSLIIASYRETFRRLGVPAPQPEQIARTIGIPLDAAFRSLTGIAALDIEKALETYREVFRAAGFKGLSTFPGMRELIRRFRDHGFTLAVASSRSHESLDDMIEYLDLTHCFKLIAGQEDSPEPKPSPAMLQAIAARLHIRCAELLMIGDTTFDIRMGHAAGAATCAVAWGNHDRTTLESAAPAAIVDTADELQALLGL